jgi:hypothetical protein
MSQPRDCYVIMPFSATASCTAEQWTEIYEEVFKPAVLHCGYACDRARPGTGSLPRSIIERLRTSFLVLADVTDRNANVFYELGVRHALSKRTIIVTQVGQALPSDLGGYWSVQYGTSPRQVSAFKADMKRLVESIESDPERSDNPVSDYLEGENASVRRSVTVDNVKKLTALYTELSGTALILDDCLFETKAIVGRSAALLPTGCLDLLLQTLYVDPGPARLSQFYEFRQDLQLIRLQVADPERIHKARAAAAALSEVVREMRERLIKGQFEEPASVSVMVWRPPAAPARLGAEPLSALACPHDAAARTPPEDVRRLPANLACTYTYGPSRLAGDSGADPKPPDPTGQ